MSYTITGESFAYFRMLCLYDAEDCPALRRLWLVLNIRLDPQTAAARYAPSNWIECGVRDPKRLEQVIAYFPDLKLVMLAHEGGDGYWYDPEGKVICDRKSPNNPACDASHWMPKPLPPRA